VNSATSGLFSTDKNIAPISSREEIDGFLQTLKQKKDVWLSISANERIKILDRLVRDFASVTPKMVKASLQAKGYPMNGISEAHEWGLPYSVVRFLHALQRSMKDIAKDERPKIPGTVTTLANGQVVAQVLPQDFYDKLFWGGMTVDVWMSEGVSVDSLPKSQAKSYFEKIKEGKVALVLGAGNVTGIPPIDALGKLFVENQVVILKLNPINAYIGPFLEKAFASLIEPGFMRIAYGGSEEGAYLCNHSLIDEIYMTGSVKTFESIVFGPGSEGAKRKESHTPLLKKPISAELGGIAPLIVVPGPWSESDIEYQAESIVALIAENGGAVCHTPRIVIQHASWSLKDQLLDQIRMVLDRGPLPGSYYPGTKDQQQILVKAHPEAEIFGAQNENQPQWTLMAGLNPEDTDDVCFMMESFFGFLGETEIKASDTPSYIDRAVEFANSHLSGTLAALIFVHPDSMKDANVADSVERAVRDLRYGMIALNYSVGPVFMSGASPWGPFPGSEIYDIQSGCGFGHNALMFSQVQKMVLRAPFRSKTKPIAFIDRGEFNAELIKRFFEFELSPSFWKVPGMILHALRG
jgi:acyl-CoA reductase-like NAD-dependent aldehyde dehydrogenase